MGQDHALKLSTAEVLTACGYHGPHRTAGVASRLQRWIDAGVVCPEQEQRSSGVFRRWPLNEARLTVMLWLACEVVGSTNAITALGRALRAVDPDEWHGVWLVTKQGAERVHQLSLLPAGWLVDLDVADERLAPFVRPLEMAVSA